MTYRERMERRAERRRTWAESREAKADAAFTRSRDMMKEIPMGQPLLVDHYSYKRDRNYRDRAWNLLGKAVEHTDMAAHHATAAAGIERQLERSIYSDDPDAIEQLEARLAELEAKRDRIKSYNATARKGKPDPSVLADDERRDLESCLRYAAYQCKGGAFPAYVLSNLAGNIKRQRDRLAALKAKGVA